MKTDIKLMGELVKLLPEIERDARVYSSELSTEREESMKVRGAELRVLRNLLDEVDPMRTWGGLRKIITPEGHHLWLCEHHAKTYMEADGDVEATDQTADLQGPNQK